MFWIQRRTEVMPHADSTLQHYFAEPRQDPTQRRVWETDNMASLETQNSPVADPDRQRVGGRKLIYPNEEQPERYDPRRPLLTPKQQQLRPLVVVMTMGLL